MLLSLNYTFPIKNLIFKPSKDLFRSKINYELSKLDVCNLEFERFLNIFNKFLNKQAPVKKKFLRANQGEFMTKELNKSIITRPRLRNKYLKEKTADSKITYGQQKNYCVNLLRRTKKIVLLTNSLNLNLLDPIEAAISKY